MAERIGYNPATGEVLDSDIGLYTQDGIISMSRTKKGFWKCNRANDGIIYRPVITATRPQTCPLNDFKKMAENHERMMGGAK